MFESTLKEEIWSGQLLDSHYVRSLIAHFCSCGKAAAEKGSIDNNSGSDRQ